MKRPLQAQDVISRYAAGERNFCGADLRNQSFVGQDLAGADFSQADLRGANFQRAQLKSCVFKKVRAGHTERRLLASRLWTVSLMSLFAFSVAFAAGVLSIAFLDPRIPVAIRLTAPATALASFVLFVLLILWDGLGLRTLSIVMTLAIAGVTGVVVTVPLIGPAAVVVAVSMAGPAALAVTCLVAGMVPLFLFLRDMSWFVLPLSMLLVVAGVISGGDAAKLPSSGQLTTDPRTVLAVMAVLAAGTSGAVVSRLRRGVISGEPRYAPFRLIALAVASRGATGFQGADLSGADFTEAALPLSDFRQANLTRTCFYRCSGLDVAWWDASSLSRALVQNLLTSGSGIGQRYDQLDLRGVCLRGANLRGATFRGANLEGADFEQANLQHAHLEQANLSRALLTGADLREASLHSADLAGAQLRDANLQGTVMTLATLDVITYAQSSWTPAALVDLKARGVAIIALDAFPQEASDAILDRGESLILSFSACLQEADRLLIEIVILIVLGRDSDCRIIEFKRTEESTLVRLRASHRADLEHVAEALYSRIWERQSAQSRSLRRTGSDLSELCAGLTRMELQQVDPALTQGNDSQREVAAEFLWSWDLSGNSGAEDQIKLVRPYRLFISYASADEELCIEMLAHLSVLRRQQLIDVWHQQKINGGDEIQAQQQAHLNEADVVLLLISADFLESDLCTGFEMRRAMEKYGTGRAQVVPVLLRPADWRNSPLGHLRPLPGDGRAITSWTNRDEAWESVTSGLRRVLLHLESRASLVESDERERPATLRMDFANNGTTLQRAERTKQL